MFGCPNPDLTPQDFHGACVFGELNIALGRSRSATVFLLGINPAAIMALMAKEVPTLADVLSIPPKAIIAAKGTGLGVGLALDLFVGGVV